MIEHHGPRFQRPANDGGLPVESPPAPPQRGFWGNVWQVAKTVQARLRFIVLLALVGLVIGNWSTFNNYYEKWVRPEGAAEAASSDAEWFCPMHPQIVRDNPKEKCPICHMDLAKRKKGSGKPEPLPPGTVSRVQLTPYRVVLAGVRTWEVQYLPLFKEITTYGTVEFNETQQRHVAAVQRGRIIKLYVNYTGQDVEKREKLAILDVRYSRELTATLKDLLRARQRGDREQVRMARKRLRVWDVSDEQIEDFVRTGQVNTRLTIYSPIKGHVIKKYQREGNFVEEGTPLFDVDDLETVWVEAQVYEADQAYLRKGQAVTATTLGLPGKEFRGALDFIYPHLDASTRTLTVRFHMPNPGHRLRPGMYATMSLRVPPENLGLFDKKPAGEVGRLLKRGRLLAVPDSAVIDTGRLRVVYRETSPNVFEGVLVRLGPRMAVADSPVAYYPVLDGLKAGDRVVTNGSFLIDAETRLNRAAGSIYIGGSGGSSGPSGVAVRPSTPVAVSEADQRLIKAQRLCPITGRPLGSMGTPVKVMIQGQAIFLCCDGCRQKALDHPSQTLKKVENLKAKGKAKPPTRPGAGAKPGRLSSEEREAEANIAKLPTKDQALARAQKFCPIGGELLGSMGVPFRLVLKGQPIFLCCKNCEANARKDPDKTLAKVKELKAQQGRRVRP
jgi:multidrug efflux pump subunit AcrA (membrane-fusion protein)